MIVWLISYTARGRDLGARTAELLKQGGHTRRGTHP